MAKTSYSLSHDNGCTNIILFLYDKFRRKEIYYKVRSDLSDLIDIMRYLCQYKGLKIIEGHMMTVQVYMLILIPPKLAVSDFMGYLISM